jgi:dTDP-4-amino-4,6-dideoxygalactose transaminase
VPLNATPKSFHRQDRLSQVNTTPGIRNIPLLDLTRKYRAIENQLRVEWDHITRSMQLLSGPNLKAFEQEFATYCGVKYAVGVGSGTDAIYLSLQALKIAPGDEVILPAHVPAPVIEPVIAVGATPVLMDKAVGDYGPDLESLHNAMSDKTRALLVVHMLGLPCDMNAILEIARARKIPVIEDASQAQGALFKKRRAAGLGTVTPMSLGPVKNLAAYGDAGIVLTNDEQVAQSVRLLRVHGQAEKYDHRVYGWNSRLDELQAAVLRLKLPTLDHDNARRAAIAARYSNAFHDLPLSTPPLFVDRISVFHQYVLETPQRDDLRAFLKQRGIATGMYYPLPLHKHKAWWTRKLPEYFLPESERYSSQNLAIPVFGELDNDEVAYIIDAVRDFYCT